MYETKAWEFTPTGPAEANDRATGRNIKFNDESPVFEVAKFWWNNLIPGTPRDSSTYCLAFPTRRWLIRRAKFGSPSTSTRFMSGVHWT